MTLGKPSGKKILAFIELAFRWRRCMKSKWNRSTVLERCNAEKKSEASGVRRAMRYKAAGRTLDWAASRGWRGEESSAFAKTGAHRQLGQWAAGREGRGWCAPFSRTWINLPRAHPGKSSPVDRNSPLPEIRSFCWLCWINRKRGWFVENALLRGPWRVAFTSPHTRRQQPPASTPDSTAGLGRALLSTCALVLRTYLGRST